MSEPNGPSVPCKGCGRIVYIAHVDADGRCCFCAKPSDKPSSKPTVFDLIRPVVDWSPKEGDR